MNINSENYMRIHVKRKYGLQTLLLSAYSNVKLFSNFNFNSKFHYIHFIILSFYQKLEQYKCYAWKYFLVSYCNTILMKYNLYFKDPKTIFGIIDIDKLPSFS